MVCISIVISIGSVVCTGEQTGWKEVWRRALGRIGIRNMGYFVLEKRKVWRQILITLKYKKSNLVQKFFQHKNPLRSFLELWNLRLFPDFGTLGVEQDWRICFCCCLFVLFLNKHHNQFFYTRKCWEMPFDKRQCCYCGENRDAWAEVIERQTLEIDSNQKPASLAGSGGDL